MRNMRLRQEETKTKFCYKNRAKGNDAHIKYDANGENRLHQDGSAGPQLATARCEGKVVATQVLCRAEKGKLRGKE